MRSRSFDELAKLLQEQSENLFIMGDIGDLRYMFDDIIKHAQDKLDGIDVASVPNAPKGATLDGFIVHLIGELITGLEGSGAGTMTASNPITGNPFATFIHIADPKHTNEVTFNRKFMLLYHYGQYLFDIDDRRDNYSNNDLEEKIAGRRIVWSYTYHAWKQLMADELPLEKAIERAEKCIDRLQFDPMPIPIPIPIPEEVRNSLKADVRYIFETGDTYEYLPVRSNIPNFDDEYEGEGKELW